METKIFVDTSALYALVSDKDSNYRIAGKTWEKLVERRQSFVTNNYVLAECISLLQNRLGLESVVSLQSTLLPFLTIVWIEEEQHEAAFSRLLLANRRQLSLVDCASFGTMRRLGIESVFTFDEHFREWGFTLVP